MNKVCVGKSGKIVRKEVHDCFYKQLYSNLKN